VGLVARKIEAAGIPTVTLNMIWVYQRLVGMPRVAAIEDASQTRWHPAEPSPIIALLKRRQQSPGGGPGQG
jgi:hypothetical protein